MIQMLLSKIRANHFWGTSNENPTYGDHENVDLENLTQCRIPCTSNQGCKLLCDVNNLTKPEGMLMTIQHLFWSEF